ncbi:uncharacterized protein LOC112898218 [Panicum hallii]|uniref:uncharacterized protein LOC112898218 n=1 Tax=Panicum hallii TaxID=206008 RepID=UPI000DF4E65D|nr:uncharacterized protein LOC112898218 [Panicum hallii]
MRWGEISKSTSKFCGFYAEVERKNQSGKCEDDKIKDALQLYQGVMEESFKFIHCWLILKREQKWNEFLAEKMVPKTKQAPSAAQVDPNQTPSSVPQFTEENFVRPMGRDSSKKLRAANSAASSTGCLEVLQKIHSDRAKYDARQEELVMDESREIAERYERKLKIQEETMKIHSESVSIQKELLSKQVAIQQQMLELQEKERTDRVMMADLEKFSPWVREFYIQEQKEIAAKRRMQGGQSCSAHSAEK